MSYVLSRDLWEIARPHMERLVAQTHESSSIAQLDGSDIVYVARVAAPKIITLAVTIGTRFPAIQTSLGKILIAALPPEQVEDVLAEPSRSGIAARWQPARAECHAALHVRARGWALTDEQLTPGIRSDDYLPLLLQAASAISADWAACHAVPAVVMPLAVPAS